MGKRELLLIAGFVAVGTLVYFLTAPDRPERAHGLSVSGAIEALRREIRGNQATAEVTTSATHEVPGGLSELRVNVPIAQITVLGENREDIASEFYVWSNGYDEAEAKALANRTTFRLEPAGPSLLASVDVPREGRQRLRLTLRVPARMRLQFEPTSGKLEVAGVASIDHESARGETVIRNVPGRVSVTHRGGSFTLTDVGPARVSARGSDLSLSGVNGEIVLQLQAGDLRATNLGGPVELECSGADVTLEGLQAMRGPLRINAVSGRLIVRGLSTEARIDGRDAEMEIAVDKAAPIAIYNTEERVHLIPPAGGYTIKAVATDARISVPEELKSALTSSDTEHDGEHRVSGSVRGGGPEITIRSRGGEIRLMPRTVAANEER